MEERWWKKRTLNAYPLINGLGNLVLLHITVDFATVASQNQVSISPKMFRMMILFQDCSMIKIWKFIANFWIILFSYKGKAYLTNPFLCQNQGLQACDSFPFCIFLGGSTEALYSPLQAFLRPMPRTAGVSCGPVIFLKDNKKPILYLTLHN